ncbi:MAG: N-acetylmuramoyl-L-alanine amidase [Gemmatimonadota bacterium]|nr:N-acetylmuramoyl-L-alanine amidase [Gemmatimonadota bacterium]
MTPNEERVEIFFRLRPGLRMYLSELLKKSRGSGLKACRRARVVTGTGFIALMVMFQVLVASHDKDPNGQSYFKVRLRGTLWETLIEHGVNPTRWKEVFQYNRRFNPAFKRIKSAHRIPDRTTVYIPTDWGGKRTAVKRRTGPRKSVVQDTVFRLDMTVLLVKAGRDQRLSDVLNQLCRPASIKGKQDRSRLVRNVRSDMRDFYRRDGRELNSWDRSFFIPLHLAKEGFEGLRNRIGAYFRAPELFVRRDSLLGTGEADIAHLAAPGEDYRRFAKLYAGMPEDFPGRYPFRKSLNKHLAYMAQVIRHYNLNQPVWPGKTYFIPACLVEGAYYREHPEVKLVRKTRKSLRYGNGLEVLLEYHVTRRKMYWKRRERYLPPLERRLADGSPAFPDMILWHRTGLEPEIEEVLRSRGRKHFSLRYIYRTAVTNYYIDENGLCFLVVDPEKNPRDHAGHPNDYRCFWSGQARVSDISIGIEIESGFLGSLSRAQLATARKLQELIRSRYIIQDDRVLDHAKVAVRRGPDRSLRRGRKADKLTVAERGVLGIGPILDPDVLRGLVDPNLDELQVRQKDSDDYWFHVELDPDLEQSARMAGWRKAGGRWLRPGAAEDRYPGTGGTTQ